MDAPITEIERIQTDIETYLNDTGRIFKAYREQDSGCVSYGVEVEGERWFVKHSSQPNGLISLRRAARLYTRAHHPAVPGLRNQFTTPGGMALVLDWLPGEVLYDYIHFRDKRDDPASPYALFRSLSSAEILAVLDTIFDAHLHLAKLGFIAVDFYDGCILYDFESGRTHLIDLDEYREGAFVLEQDRLPGSRRFMAPEEWQRGAQIDQVTNVYTMGRTALLLLGDGSGLVDTWKGGLPSLSVALKAASTDRRARYDSLEAFVRAWRHSVLET